ncbi:protein O-linked-mannose beta-1,2-N-acetylglucosaminyltransferase 1-like isoform X1 [Procambarus clarkii]|uniref:protein O-linked-mannose beta-1,2-N-acetylglucosaminyltransferase 1-like isoform X1 n=1 Tax=Procambarus clarkii TaxID=6728 RepID=UPI003742926A
MLVKMVHDVQDGRLILFLGAPDFVAWIQDDMVETLLALGSRLGPLAARGEAWAFVTRKGHAPLHETLIISRNSSTTDVSPLAFSATLPVFPERACPWYQEPEWATKAEFCEIYEGYHDFCHCLHPLHLHPSTSPHLQLEEVIPVALVTARRLQVVARQVEQLWSSPGGGQTPLAILVDGYNPQAEMLASILNLTVRFHDNPVPRGTKHRVNQHIKFSLETIFELYPEVDKAIILEDDLSLAPDFIDYFQQTSILMSADPTVMCVNAYNYNAFPHTAHDPARIYRVQTYPYYGWMTSRAHARRMLANWAPLDANADWDLYVGHYHVDEHHEVVIPEVPRTRHEGGGGVHVTGLEQEVAYDRRPLNTHTNVTLNLRRHWQLAYSLDKMAAIKLGTIVNVTKHPCIEAPVPKYQRNTTHVIYIYHTGDDNKENAYKVLGKCMGFYHQNSIEHFRGTFSFKFFETPVILVSCYSSAYCDEVPRHAIYRPSQEALTYAKRHPWRQSNSTSQITWRIPPAFPIEEFVLQNVVGIEVIINE